MRARLKQFILDAIDRLSARVRTYRDDNALLQKALLRDAQATGMADRDFPVWFYVFCLLVIFGCVGVLLAPTEWLVAASDIRWGAK